MMRSRMMRACSVYDMENDVRYAIQSWVPQPALVTSHQPQLSFFALSPTSAGGILARLSFYGIYRCSSWSNVSAFTRQLLVAVPGIRSCHLFATPRDRTGEEFFQSRMQLGRGLGESEGAV